MADFFGVDRTTVVEWRKVHEEFADAVRQGKLRADMEVAVALYRRAIGYEHEAVKIFADPKSGEVLKVPYIERYPPDAASMIFWLKNRRRADWRDKPFDETAPQDRARELREALKQIAADAEGTGEG